MTSHDPFAYAAHALIERHRERSEGRNPSGLYFHKVMFLLNRELKARNFELGFPYGWYLYGPETVRGLCPGAIQFHQRTPGRTDVHWVGDPPGEPEWSDHAKTIVEAIEAYLARYPPEAGAKPARELVDEVYRHAPFDFQRRFRELVLFLAELGHYQAGIEGVVEFIQSRLDEMESRFPDRDFPTLGGRWELVAEAVLIALRLMPPSVSLTQEILTRFWELFCKFLRLHPLAHENLTEEWLAWKRRGLLSEIDAFDNAFVSQVATMERETTAVWSENMICFMAWARSTEAEREASSRALAEAFAESKETLASFRGGWNAPRPRIARSWGDRSRRCKA